MRTRCQKCGRSYDTRERADGCPHPLKQREAEIHAARRYLFNSARRTHVIVGDHSPERKEATR